MNYSEQQKQKCFERIQEFCDKLPSFAEPYINNVATRKDTSFRTGAAYAYDLFVFFRYIQEVLHVPKNKITPAYLDSLLPMDIDKYISSLASFYTDDDKQHNQELREAKTKEKRKKSEEKDAKLLRKPEKSHHMSASARARNLAAVRGLYKYLIKNGMCKNNPAALADTPRIASKDVIALDSQQAKDVMSKTKNTDIARTRKQFAERQKKRDVALLSLLLYTGIRVSECVGIDIGDFDWENNSVKVLRKGGGKQSVFFNEETRNALISYIDEERTEPLYDKNALFVTRFNERMSTQAVDDVVKKYTNGVSVHKITPHKLRSTYATALYNATNDAYEVKDALGHKTLGVVQKYISESEKHRKAAATHIKY